MGIDDLIAKASEYLKDHELDKIREAFKLADKAHKGQVRKSGEPFIQHPLAVADIVVDMRMDATS